jgi:putative transposase
MPGGLGGILTDLYRRGLTEEGLELMVTDGGTGLLAALPMVCPGTPVQRCWAHKSRNILTSVRRADREAVTADLHTIQYTL